MTKTSLFLRYIIPAALVGAMVAFSVSLEVGTRRDKPEDAETMIAVPHGQCLIVVVEGDGIYVGKDRIPFEQFGTVFDAVYRKQKLDWAIVFGSNVSRFGDAVQVYSKLREAFGNRITLETVPVRPGERWQAVERLDSVCGWPRMPAPAIE